MSLHVTIRDEQTGDVETVRVSDGNYLLLCTQPCHESHVQAYPLKGTHVITIKDVRPKELPPE